MYFIAGLAPKFYLIFMQEAEWRQREKTYEAWDGLNIAFL